MRTIIVEDYDPRWAEDFQILRRLLAAAVGQLLVSIEHVGSTSVPGLAAKPILDVDIVVPDRSVGAQVTAALVPLGYQSQGDLGIPGREALQYTAGAASGAATASPLPAHHLYVVLETSDAWENHWRLRDYLRRHPEAVAAYGRLKKKLAAAYPHDIEAYIAGKTPLLAELLLQAGVAPEVVADIRRRNENPQAD